MSKSARQWIEEHGGVWDEDFPSPVIEAYLDRYIELRDRLAQPPFNYASSDELLKKWRDDFRRLT